MKRILSLMVALSAVVLSASTCDKEALALYHDADGNSVSLIGRWGLVAMDYETAGVVETREIDPQSLMEFQEDGYGRTLRLLPDGMTEELDSWRYEKYRAAVTIFTHEEWENNRYLSDDDPMYEEGKTYYFRIQDENTIWYREKVTSGSYITHVFARF